MTFVLASSDGSRRTFFEQNRLYSAGLMLLLPLALSACNTPSPNEQSGGPPSKRPATTKTTHASNEQRIALESVVRRRDAPPKGVAEQLSYFSGGDGPCGDIDSYTYRESDPYREPTIKVSGFHNPPEIGEAFDFCFPAFNPSRALTVQVEFPTGRVVRKIVPPDWTAMRWEPRPRDPIGTYRVSVTQDGATASTLFKLVESTGPVMRIIQPEQQDYNPPEPGDTVELALVGYPPNRPALVHLYKPQQDDRYDYLSSIEVAIGPNGRGYVIITTTRDAKPGCYLFASDLKESDSNDFNNELCILSLAG
jgi:hypothetical protein